MAETMTTGKLIKQGAEKHGFLVQHDHGNIYTLRRKGKPWAWFQVNSAAGLVSFATPHLIASWRTKDKCAKLIAEMEKAANA